MNSPHVFPAALQAHIVAGCDLLSTKQAAAILGLKPQTLRKWACYDKSPHGLKPVKPGRHLKWPVEQLAKLIMGGG